jgi:D-alanyl-D-alanine carboxypeptidase
MCTFMRPFLLRHRRIVSIGASYALMISVCSAEPMPSTPVSSTPTTATGTRASSPALKPIDQAALRSTVATAAKELLVPGTVVLLRTAQGQFAVNYGTTQLGATTPPSADTHFRIASNTKTMTAAVVMQLAQEGKLKLDDPVSKYVAGVPNGDNISITELLEMRSGLYNYTNSEEVSSTIDRDPTKVWTPNELLAIAFKQPADAPPGTEFEYNNTNYALLGLVIEKVDGRPLAEAMQNRLFKPLSMKNTLLPAATSNVMPRPYSHGYLYGSSSVALVGTPDYSPEFQAAAKAGKQLPKDYTDVNHSFAAAAGGVVSTAADLATWIEAIVTGRVLNAEYQRLWLQSVQLEDPSKPEGQKYGYGIAYMHWGSNAFYFHGGETPGYNSFIGYDPSNKVTLIVWTNLTVSLDESPTANALMLKVLDQIYVESPIQPSPATTKAP